jgi:hypothetical protein
VAGCCEYGDEPSGCIQFLDYLRTCQLLTEDSAPCS